MMLNQYWTDTVNLSKLKSVSKLLRAKYEAIVISDNASGDVRFIT